MPPPIQRSFQADLCTAFERMFATGHYADVELVCRNYTFRVHKAVLYVHSPVLANLLAGPRVVQAPSRVLLMDEQPGIMHWFLWSLYYLQVPDLDSVPQLPADYYSTLLVALWVLADKFGCLSLRLELLDTVRAYWNAHRRSADFIRCLAAIEAISDSRNATPMWDVVIPIATDNFNRLLYHEDFHQTIQHLPKTRRMLQEALDDASPPA